MQLYIFLQLQVREEGLKHSEEEGSVQVRAEVELIGVRRCHEDEGRPCPSQL